MRHLLVSIAVLLVGGVPPANANFFDVPDDHPYSDAIYWLGQQGIVRGYENRSFRPENAISRAEFTKVLTKMLYPSSFIDECISADPVEFLQIPELSFPDVPLDSWFAPYVCAAWINGVVGGYSDGTFKPENGVNFAEASKMIAIGYGLTGIELPDLGEKANAIWYLPYVRLLADAGAIPLSIDEVGKPLLRGEMAEIMYRLRDLPKLIEPVPELTRTYDEVVYPLGWETFESRTYRFQIDYVNVWPGPHLLKGGSYDGKAPYQHSSWRYYFGPKPERCFGLGECIERDITIDAYEMRLLDQALDELELSETTTIISESENEKLYKVIYDEDDGRCQSKGALLVRPLDTPGYRNREFLRLRMKCAGDSEDRSHTFRRILQSFEFLKLY